MTAAHPVVDETEIVSFIMELYDWSTFGSVEDFLDRVEDSCNPQDEFEFNKALHKWWTAGGPEVFFKYVEVETREFAKTIQVR